MTQQPLAEIFGFPIENNSTNAQRYRINRLCPYNNRVANCTKDKANDPLGICSIFDNAGNTVITCPIRFRENWLIADDAASFFFPPNSKWTSLTEIRLNDKFGRSAGNIDVVLVSYDEGGKVVDFGSLEVQAVYISGNVRRLFEEYMRDPHVYNSTDWTRRQNVPRPDYLSSSRKRLVPQLIYKGGILKSWQKKQAVALHRSFYQTLPKFDEVDPQEADLVWLIYDLVLDETDRQYHLVLYRKVYTMFTPSLNKISNPEVGITLCATMDETTSPSKFRIELKGGEQEMKACQSHPNPIQKCNPSRSVVASVRNTNGAS